MDALLGLLALACLLLGFATYAHFEPAARAPVLAAFALRASAALWHAFVAPLPDSHADAVMFAESARHGFEAGLAQWLIDFTTGAFLYPWVISGLYLLAAPSELLAQSVNVGLGTLAVALTFHLARRLWGEGAAKAAAWILALYPTAILYSAITLRECFIVVPFLFGLLAVARWSERQAVAPYWAALGLMTASTILHTAFVAGVMALGLLAAASLAAAMLRANPVGLARSLLALGPFLGGAAFMLATGSGLEKLGDLEDFGLDKVQEQIEYVSRERPASYLEGLTVASWGDLVLQLPVRLLYFIGAPFPWMVSRAVDVMALLDALACLALFALGLVAVRRHLASAKVRSLALVLALVLALFAVATSNFGTAVRHRGKLVPLLVVLAVGLAVPRAPRPAAPPPLPGALPPSSPLTRRLP